VVGEFEDKAAFALQILSNIYYRSERVAKGVDADKAALKLNPLLWQSFESLCTNRQPGELVKPEEVWSSECLDELAHITGANPLVNLLNSGPSVPVPGPPSLGKGKPPPPTALQTPLPSSDRDHIPTSKSLTKETPLSMLGVSMGLCPPETPLLHYNSVSSALLHQQGLSGISSLNLTEGEQDHSIPLSVPRPKPPNFLPPPVKPKRPHSQLPRFGVLSPTCVSPVSGLVAKLVLEFSPQAALLSPLATALPSLTPALLPGSPCLPSMPTKGLGVTPGTVLTPSSGTTVPPLRSSTPGVQPQQPGEKRVAMASNNLNVKPGVLGPSAHTLTTPNLITSSPANSQPTRRSSRLFTTQSVKENSKTPNKGRIKSKSKLQPSNRHLSENELNEKNTRDNLKSEKDKLSCIFDTTELKPCTPVSMNKSKANLAVSMTCEAVKMQKASLTGLLSLLKQVGAAFVSAASYDCREAVRRMNSLSPKQSATSWVLGLLGKCHFELAEYKEASKIFKKVRELDPYRLDLQEYASTALWQMQDEVELSALAQDLQRIDRSAPETLCAAGNCFSHQKEHENAIKFFQRAIQVKPDFAYAYTLLGHEYVLVEELDKAMSCFRTAVRLESRHYNAWYGIGMIFYKQERLKMAEIYYRKALSINPHSPVLLCHVAVVQHGLSNTTAALETLNRAIKVSPKNPLCKFEKASILHSVERYEEALEELNDLKQIVPKESPVFFLMGKVHNRLGNTHLALMHFSWAMDLDPKGANSQIKDALEPALNRAGQDLGLNDSQDGEAEPMLAETSHEDYQGEISDAFDPPAGENIISPDSPSEPRTAAGGLLLQDSDDSL